MYTIGALKKKEENINPPLTLTVQKKDWLNLVSKNITKKSVETVETDKIDEVNKIDEINTDIHIVDYSNSIKLHNEYIKYMKENEDYIRDIYCKMKSIHPHYFDKLYDDRGFIIFSRFIFSQFIKKNKTI
jgi:hypothetical protein